MKSKLFTCAAVLSFVGSVLSAQTFEEVLKEAEGQVGQMGQYQQALQNPDPRMQYALVQQMLKLKDPALQRIAKEHALFSTNPVMREAAIKAVLDSGTTLRIQIAGKRDAIPNIIAWATQNGGSFTDKQAQVLYRVQAPLKDDCWGHRDTCYIRQVGTAVQLTPYFANRSKLGAVLNLGNDGILRGTMNFGDTEFAQIQIDLKE